MNEHPEPGQWWKRKNGTLFKIERVAQWYWLNAGSKPQYRSIRLENLKAPEYTRVKV